MLVSGGICVPVITAGAVADLTFDGTSFQLANYGGGGGTASIVSVQIPRSRD